ncbi:MAG: hypothetical protein H7096_14175 [Flavobacterium sp.]|nr:hypothetical protein [Pedobacter sp.]
MKKLLISKSIFGIFIIFLVACSSNPMKGTWQYDGGIYNDKQQNASADFKMNRTYSADKYEAFILEEGVKTEKYASGRYEMKGDSFLVTSEYSLQPSQTIGKTIGYKYKLEKNRLTLNGILPNGMKVEEYWKKIK